MEVLLNGQLQQDLSAYLQTVETTLKQESRPGLHDRASSLFQAKIGDRLSLDQFLALEPRDFKWELANWVRRSGRFTWTEHKGGFEVYFEGRPHPDMTELIERLRREYSGQAARRYLKWGLAFINFEANPGEDPFAFIFESKELVRYRVTEWIEQELRLTVTNNGFRDNHVERKKGDPTPIDERAKGLSAVRHIYEILRKTMGLRSGENPLSVDGFDAMSTAERMREVRIRNPKAPRSAKYAGAQFVAIGRQWYPPVPFDPTHAFPTVQAGIDKIPAFPSAVSLQIEVMDLEGQRPSDTIRLMVGAWAAGGFGRILQAHSKGHGSALAKYLILAEDLVGKFEAAIDARHLADPDRPATLEDVIERALTGNPVFPSMDQLRALRQAGRKDILDLIPLFPSSLGAPYSYEGFMWWFSRATAGTTITTSQGPRKPTPVWLRRAKITREVLRIYREEKTDEDIRRRLQILSADFGHKSVETTLIYAASIKGELWLHSRLKRADQDVAWLKANRANAPLGQPLITTEVTLKPATQALLNRAKA